MGYPNGIVQGQNTILQVKKLISLYREGRTPTEAAEMVGVSPPTAIRYLKESGFNISQKGKRRRKDSLAQYAAYDRETDELICIGTCEEMAKCCGIKECTLRSYIILTL